MPLSVVLMLQANLFMAEDLRRIVTSAGPEGPELLGADGRDLRVVAAEISSAIQERVNMEGGGLGAASQLSEPQNQLFLEVVGELVLGTEEDDTSL